MNNYGSDKVDECPFCGTESRYYDYDSDVGTLEGLGYSGGSIKHYAVACGKDSAPATRSCGALIHGFSKEDALYDKAYADGAKAGWNASLSKDARYDHFLQSINNRWEQAREVLSKASPQPSGEVVERTIDLVATAILLSGDIWKGKNLPDDFLRRIMMETAMGDEVRRQAKAAIAALEKGKDHEA